MRTENALRGTFPMKSETVGAVIMASGLARRFGSNKLLADFGGEPMLCRVLRATEGISPRIVVTRSEDVHRLCVSLGVPVLLHTLPHRSDTVRLGLDALLREMPSLCGCLFAPGDQPLLRRETVDGLCGAFLETPEKERTIYRLARKEAGAAVCCRASGGNRGRRHAGSAGKAAEHLLHPWSVKKGIRPSMGEKSCPSRGYFCTDCTKSSR